MEEKNGWFHRTVGERLWAQEKWGVFVLFCFLLFYFLQSFT